MNECEKCGRKRSDGWLLIDDLCAECGPLGFRNRRSDLLEQARNLMAEEVPTGKEAA